MFKGWPVRDSRYNKSIKDSLTKVSSIELVAELIQVFLQVFLFYPVIHVPEQAFCIGYGCMTPTEEP
jgi:hypothetical protein